MKALRLVLFWFKERGVKPGEGTLKLGHQELYKRIREEFKLPSKMAEDCHRDVLAVYKGRYKIFRRGRFLWEYKPTVWLTPRLSYSLGTEKMVVRIASVGELPILGIRNLSVKTGR